MPEDRLSGLDFLRALACAMVVVHHMMLRLDPRALHGPLAAAYPTLLMGAFGVAIFFLLSGFLLSRPFWLAFDSGRPMPSLASYAMRRAARIVPAYYLALIVSFLLTISVFHRPPAAQLFVRLVAGLSFLNGFHPITLLPVEYDGPLWSIGFEVFSYLLLPLAVLAVFALAPRRQRWQGRAIFAGAIAVALAIHATIVALVPQTHFSGGWYAGLATLGEYWFPHFNPIGFFAFFALGGLAAGLSVSWRGRHWGADLAVLAALAAAAFVLTMAGHGLKPEALGWLDEPYAFPWFHLAVAAALVAFPHTRFLPVLTDARPVVFLARISFGVYLWHLMIMEIVGAIMAPELRYTAMSDIGAWLALSAVSIGLALLTATASWYLLERPIIAWARRLEPARRPAPVQQAAEIVS